MREYMDKRRFSIIDHENLEIVDRAIAQLEALGATIVEPKAEDNGLLTPYLQRHYPALMNAAYAEKEGADLFPEGMDMISQLLTLAEHPGMAGGTGRNALNIMNLKGGQFDGQGMYSLSKYLRERGDENVRTIDDLVSKAKFFKDTRYHNPQRVSSTRTQTATAQR